MQVLSRWPLRYQCAGQCETSGDARFADRARPFRWTRPADAVPSMSPLATAPGLRQSNDMHRLWYLCTLQRRAGGARRRARAGKHLVVFRKRAVIPS